VRSLSVSKRDDSGAITVFFSDGVSRYDRIAKIGSWSEVCMSANLY